MRLTINGRLRGLIINSLLFALLWGQTAGSALAESPLDGSIPSGLKSGSPTGSYESLIDTINLFNGNLNFRIPLLSVGGRGEAAFPLVFAINPKWIVIREPRPGEPALLYPFFKPGKGVGTYKLTILQAGSRDFTNRCPGQGNVRKETLTILKFTGPDGTTYELRDKLTNGEPNSTACAPFNRGRVFVAADGTSTTFISDTDIFDYPYSSPPADIHASGYLLLRDGTRLRIEPDERPISSEIDKGDKCVWARDRNGNRLNFSLSQEVPLTVTDPVGRQVVHTLDTIDFKGYGGAPRTIRIQGTNLGNALRSEFHLRTERNLFPQLNDSSALVVVNPGVTSSIMLPNNRQYKFYYNSYAELARIELPTGGAIEYDYAPGLTDGPESGYMNLGVVGGHHIYRRVVERRVYPEGGSGDSFAIRTTYSRPESSLSNAGYVQTDQYDSTGALLGSQRHYFHGSARDSFGKEPTRFSPWREGMEYQTEELDILSGTVLRRVTHTWSQPMAGGRWPLTQPETQAGVKPNDPQITETVTTLCDVTPNLVSKKTFEYDEYNNQTDVYEYGFGMGDPGPLIRRTHTSYLTTNGNQGDADYAADLNIHIRNLPVQRIVYDVSSNVRSQTDFFYDDYEANPPVDRPDIVQHDSGFHPGYGARGNLTRLILHNPGGSPSEINLNNQYDVAGNLVKAIDGRGFPTDFYFDDCFGATDNEARSNAGAPELAGGFAYAFPTRVTNALGHTAYTQYDYYTGKLVNTEDINGLVGSVAYNDALDRPTQGVQARYKVGVGVPAERRQTTVAYDDVKREITSTGDLSTFNDNVLISKSYYDSLGRTRRSAAREGATWTIADIQYDALGRVSKVSTPYRAADPDTASPPSGAFAAWTTTDYDAFGRVIRLTTPDSAHVDTAYSGNLVTVTDQAGKRRRSEIDALGRLITVIEDPGGLSYETSYFYDALDNLRQVTQGSQTRTFVYDSLSRLTSATNPESGTMTYAYDSNGNLIEKTDARGVMTTMGYDKLNRIRSKAYTGLTAEGTVAAGVTPQVNYFYDSYSGMPSGAPSWPGTPSNGRLTGVTYGPGSDGTYYKYDAAGRIVTNHQRMGTSNYVTAYLYNRAGAVTREDRGGSSQTRRRNWMSYDAAGRFISMQSGARNAFGIEPQDLVSDISYTPFGALQSETYGNGLIHSMAYNERHQPIEISLGRHDNLESVFRIGYIYGTAHNVNGQDAEITPAQNNGNVARIKYLISGTVQHAQTFQYDPVNRLRYAVEHNNGVYNDEARAWYQTFAYDPYGNRGIDIANTSDNVDAANSALQLADFSEANNRITSVGFIYDAAGNLIAEPGKSYTYDAENRMVTATLTGGGTSQYFYDGNGRRVKKIVGGVGTRFEYGAGGELITERNDSNGNVIKDYLYKGGELLATSKIGNSGEYEYATADHLGSPRAWTDGSGNLIAGGRHDYLPFGEELSAGIGTRSASLGYGDDSTRQKFGSKERDNETGLDYFLARYYSNTQGRFTSVDPIVVTPERFFDPQQFNLYSYVRNNPLRFIDPTGEKLTISGDIEEVKRQLLEILGMDDAEKRIKFIEKTNTITVDLSGIDLEKNEGANLLNDVIKSDKVYDVTVGSSVETLGGQLSLAPTLKGGNVVGSSIVNLDNNPDDRLKSGKRDIDKPKKGVNDQIGINFDFRRRNSKSTTNLSQALDFTVTFHELAEAYAKVDGNMQYAQAHQRAIDRETRLREQRPYLKGYNPGSGPGTSIIIKQ